MPVGRRWTPCARPSPLPAVVALALACGPTPADEPAAPPRVLEYESIAWYGGEWYRLDRRVEYVPGEAPWDQPQCGYLTERAHAELEAAIAALDPSMELGDECYRDDCGQSHCPDALVHLEGFEHSPFYCDELCCPAELDMVAWTYFHVTSNLSGVVLEIEGEPYEVIEPDRPCP